MSWIRRLMQTPVTLVITLASLVAMVVPGLTSWLEFDAISVASGEYWRLLTAQLTHFSWNHIAWDLAVFACLGYLCESRSRWLTYLTLVLSTVFIASYCVMHLDQYRGLSGLDTALFALLNTLLLRQRYRERDWTAVGVLATLLLLMLGKIGWETITGNCLFVDTAGQFTTIPFAHLVGAVVGLTLGSLRFDRPTALSPEDKALTHSGNVRHRDCSSVSPSKRGLDCRVRSSTQRRRSYDSIDPARKCEITEKRGEVNAPPIYRPISARILGRTTTQRTQPVTRNRKTRGRHTD